MTDELRGDGLSRATARDQFHDLAAGHLSPEFKAYATVELTDRAILARDLGSFVRMWNPAATALYGYREDEALGRVSHDLLATRFPAPLGDIERELFDSGAWEGPLLHLTKNGDPLLVVSRWVLQRTPEGAPNAVLEFNRSADLWEVGALLAPDREERIDRVYLYEPVRDQDGKVIDLRLRYVNEEGLVFNSKSATLIGMPTADWFPEFRSHPLFRRCCEVIKSGTPREFRDIRLQPPWLDEPYVIDGRVVPFGELIAVRARDVTVERRALQALDNAQARIRVALAAAPVLMVQTDSDLIVNWVGGNLPGGNADAFMGQRVGGGLADAERQRVEQAAQRVLDTGREARLEVQGPGTPITDADVVMQPRVQDGRTVGLIISILDISDYRRAQRAAENSRRIMHTVLDNTADLVWLKDRDGHYLFHNRAAVEHLARPAENLRGRSVHEVVPHSVARRAATADREIIRTGKPLTSEETLRTTLGERTFAARRFPITDEHGEVVAVGGIASDITDQIERDAEIRLNATAMENAAEGIAIARERDMRLLQVNDRFAQMFGWTREDLEGQPVTVLNAPTSPGDDGTGTAHEILEQLHRDGRATVRVHNIRRDGSRLWTESIITPFDHPEHGPVWINVQRDITDRVELEEALGSVYADLADAKARLAEHGIT